MLILMCLVRTPAQWRLAESAILPITCFVLPIVMGSIASYMHYRDPAWRETHGHAPASEFPTRSVNLPAEALHLNLAHLSGNVLQLSYACDGKDTLVFPALAAHPPCVSRRHCMSMVINERGYIYAGIRIAHPP